MYCTRGRLQRIPEDHIVRFDLHEGSSFLLALAAAGE
jgi:hypothetical protein